MNFSNIIHNIKSFIALVCDKVKGLVVKEEGSHRDKINRKTIKSISNKSNVIEQQKDIEVVGVKVKKVTVKKHDKMKTN